MTAALELLGTIVTEPKALHNGTTVHGYVVTAIEFHLSLLIGLLFYGLRDSEPNSLAGLRTPRTLNSPEEWTRAHGELGGVVPAISLIFMCVAILGLWLPPLRTGAAFVVMVGAQVLVLLLFTARWWGSGPASLSITQATEPSLGAREGPPGSQPKL